MEHVIGSLLHKCSQPNMGYELLSASYFCALKKSNELVKIARSSYCEARQKISWEAFAILLDEVVIETEQKWHGHAAQLHNGSKYSKALLPMPDVQQ